MVCPWVIEVWVWDVGEKFGHDHFPGHGLAAGLDLTSDVEKKGIA